VTGLAFLLFYLAGCTLALVHRPIYGLMTYVAVFYLHPPSRWWGTTLPGIRWAFVAAMVTAVAVVIHNRRRNYLPLIRHKITLGLLLFLGWLYIQYFWALDQAMHLDLLEYMTKYLLVIWLMYRCIDTEANLKLFLWTHVLGCGYFGWIAYTSYSGGRFEGFGGPSMEDANAAALQIVTGVFVAASLFLGSRSWERVGLLGVIPFIVNALITTISRSGFLALGCAGLVFNYFAPRRFASRVRVFSILGAILFIMLAGPAYWERIGSLQYVGEEVEGVDTGAGRLLIMQAQAKMFLEYPYGCGHRCTATLSPNYLPRESLSTDGGRSSHNTFMTLLVEQGLIGAMFYLLFLIWILKSLLYLRRETRQKDNFLAAVFPTVAAVLFAITVADLFVDYLKLEVRFWFIGLVLVMIRFVRIGKRGEYSFDIDQKNNVSNLLRHDGTVSLRPE